MTTLAVFRFEYARLRYTHGRIVSSVMALRWALRPVPF